MANEKYVEFVPVTPLKLVKEEPETEYLPTRYADGYVPEPTAKPKRRET